MTDYSPPPVHNHGEPLQQCYRHRDRAAGVTCQRCNRPICPSCMVTASVGFQCPECARGAPGASRLLQNHLKRTEPYVTYALIAANAIVFLVGLLGASGAGSVFGDGGAMNEHLVLWAGGVVNGDWWLPISSGFVHFGLIHLMFNMYALYLLGGALERSVGRLNFVIIYFLSMIGGSLLVLATSDARTATAGASGAVFGLFGAFAALELSRGINPLKTAIGSTILLNLVITFAFHNSISVGGHIGGLITGGLCGALLFGINPAQARTRKKQSKFVAPGFAVVGIAMFGACLAVARWKVGL